MLTSGKQREQKAARRHAGHILKNQNKSCDLKANSSLDVSNQNSVSTKVGVHHVNCFPVKTSLVLKKPQLNIIHAKSVSLVELNESTKLFVEKSKGRCQEDRGIIIRTKQMCFLNSYRECKLAKKVCHNFILNAWRHRRKQVVELEKTSDKLKIEVQNLNLQTNLLANLFQSETLRVAVARSDASHLRARLESEINVIEQLKQDLNSLTVQKEVWQNNELLLNSKLASLDKYSTAVEDALHDATNKTKIYEGELAKSKENESQLLAKLTEAEGISKKKDIALSILKKKFLDSKAKADMLVAKSQSLESEKTITEKQLDSYKSRLEKMDVDLNNLQNTTKVKNLKIKELSDVIVEMELKLKTNEQLTDKLELLVETNRKEKEKYTNKCKDVTLSLFKVFLQIFLTQEL